MESKYKDIWVKFASAALCAVIDLADTEIESEDECAIAAEYADFMLEEYKERFEEE